MPRRASPHLLACALALVTAVALLRAAELARETPVAARPSDGTAGVVRAFYGAVNQVLRSGDPTALDAVVAPNLAMHPPPPGVTADRAGLGRYLAVVQTTHRYAQIVLDDLVVGGDRAMARLTIRSGDRDTFLGLRLSDGPVVWGGFDALRVHGGRVVELWSDAGGRAVLEPLLEIPAGVPLSISQAVRLDRLTFNSGAYRASGPTTVAQAIFVEAGTISVEIDSSSPASASFVAAGGAGLRPTTVAPGTRATLSVGDAVVLSASTHYALVDYGGMPRPVLLSVVFPRYPYSGPLQPTDPTDPIDSDVGARSAPDGVTVERLTDDATASPISGPWATALGRVVLSPGAVVSFEDDGGLALLYVEAGSLRLEPNWEASAVDPASRTLDAGGWVPVASDAGLRLVAAGDESLFVLVLTLQSDGAGTG
jgi:hypothetical protein